MNVDAMRAVDEWVAFYRQEFALPVQERGGYVMLPVTSAVGVVHVPNDRARRVLDSLVRQHLPGPLLARQIRWTFVVRADCAPGLQIYEGLIRMDVCIPVPGSALMLPTSLGRHTREGCYWVKPPSPGTDLPPLSALVTTILAV
ncbi:hypothetical protein ACLMAL_05720 [Nocardia sp. CWNU-33]|uniref:hypothetical protein n=1 Tax=Nocardia sp. CWNU-33 TaxID=3392117 RepID=UPI00398EE4C2